jgi:hypothetical protein
MIVGIEHVRDPKMFGFRELEIDVDVPPRIDHDGLAATPDEVGSATQVAVQDLSKEHADSPCRRKSTDVVENRRIYMRRRARQCREIRLGTC